MTIDNFKSDDSGKRKYTRVTQESFEELLQSVSEEFHIIGTEEDSNLKFTREIVYGHPLGDDDLQLRVYSAIDERTAKARDKGEDAIRTVIWNKELCRPIGGRTKTLRIETWKSNLAPKIKEILNQWEDKVVRCDECGGWMVKREPGKGDSWDTFYGCAKYPLCKNSENIMKLREGEGKDV